MVSISTISFGMLDFKPEGGTAKLGPRLSILRTGGGISAEEMLCTQSGLVVG